MGRINVLDKHVANMIAAGEVVENPASVVKELLENAIDAKATSVTCEIQSGGISYIRITDDGIGMSAPDAKTAFLRHATSKISKAEDLDSIATLGFRGEALAAISSVSKIDLITKTRDADMGVALRVEAGNVIREGESGCPDGTTIIVRELFYNTPARMRFLKKDSTEGANVENVVRACALAHPDVSIKFIKDGRDILHTPGDGLLKSCIYAVFGRDFANNMNEVSTSERNIMLSGFTCAPSASRGNRALQFFFVNGRPVKSGLLAAALDNAYRERLMKGRFPTCVLNIKLPLGSVDVNVHPAKTEVKFASERDVFDVVYFGVKTALEKSERREIVPPKINLKPEPVDNITENQQKIAEPVVPQKREEPEKTEEVKLPFVDSSARVSLFEQKPRTMLRSTQFGKYNTESREKTEEKTPEKETVVTTPSPIPAPVMQVKEEPKKNEIPLRLIGEAMSTYIIVESGDSVFFIDKHAAHERIIFEKLKKTIGEPQSQMLLVPETVSLDKVSAEVLLDNRDEISKIGFDIEEFGDGCVVCSAVPDGIDAHDAAKVLEEISELLKTGARAKRPDVLSEVMYSVACKAAIKAGQKNSPEELLALAKRVLCEDDIRYCPHGRPVMIEYTKNELEKKFKRTV
ncbi:MAG: DNA mismatch repair endonuclease MutL [Oscillospiraceae bacterium]|nr:DNA mismatch repair endonuclease MutL [Oscillospiraceae bacterium]